MSNPCTEDVPDDWDPVDDYDGEDWEDEMYDCHGHFDQPGKAGIFMCGAVGSEDCDECPMHGWLGLNHRQIDRLEEAGDE